MNLRLYDRILTIGQGSMKGAQDNSRPGFFFFFFIYLLIYLLGLRLLLNVGNWDLGICFYT